MSKQEDLFFDSKQRNPKEVENQRSILLFQTGTLRDSNFWEEKLIGTAICFQILAVRTSGVTDGQNHHSEQQQLRTKNIESHQRRLILVSFDARRHPTFLERRSLISLVPIKKQFFLVRDFRRGERFNNQIQKSWWKVFRSLVIEASSFETAPHKLSPKNAKTPCPSKKTFSLIQNKEILK